MSFRLSIIIPFYNVEQYIAQCLDSVFDQDIPLDEYEVICVNDGSPDHSRDIVLDYMKRYPNLRLIEHEHNKKLGAARNTGRKAARGKYIWNVDSDDMIVPNCLGAMLNACEAGDLDVLVFKVTYFDDKQNYDQPNYIPTTIVPIKGLEYLSQIEVSLMPRLCPVWNKIIRREFLDINHIYSPEINMGEDVPYSFSVMIHAQRVMIIDQKFYCYRQNPASLTGKDWTPQVNTLYEKCYQNSRLIYHVAKDVPASYYKVKESICSIARYTLMVMSIYYPKLSVMDRSSFRALCRKRICRDLHVFQLLSSKSVIRYLWWLFGNEKGKVF